MRYTLPAAFAVLFITSGSTTSAQGDQCSNALFIVPGSLTADGPSLGGGASQLDATNADWYAFDPTSSGLITISSCSDGVTDTRVHAHQGNCGTLTALGSDDDGCPAGYPPGNSLLANIPVAPGDIYYIEFDDRWTGDSFDWTLFFHTCPVPMPQFSASDSSITVTWTEVAPGASFFVELGPPGFTQGTGTMITGTVGVDGPPVSFFGLDEGTTYDVYVSLDCGGEVSPMIGAWPATTAGNLLVPNDDCVDATPLTCGVAVIDSTTLALPDIAPECGTTITAPGRWYGFTGNGMYQIASTCAPNTDYDTKLVLYTGTCDSLVCVAGNDDGGFCDLASEVGAITVAGEPYYLLVQGYDGALGTYELTLDCPTCAPPLAVAISPSDVALYVFWNSINTGSSFIIEVGPVGFIPGTGMITSGTVGVDGPPVLVTGLMPATDYEVYISEDCGGDPSPSVGAIAFSTLTDPPPANTFCTEALPISCGNSVAGNTNGAVLSLAPTCGSAVLTTEGLWYTFVGTGEDVTLSTCDQATYDSMISVFSGGCGNLTCAAGNDDGQGCGANTSKVTFFAINGEEYHVLVHGFEGSVGTFTLSMTCVAACTPVILNDECSSASTIAPQPIGDCTPLQATNICAYGTPMPNPVCDPYSNIVDVWFTFNTGPNADHNLIVTAGTAALVNVSVYADCGELAYITCAIDLGGPMALTGLALNTDHYLRVWNAGYAEAGTFSICDEADIDDAIAESAPGRLTLYPNPGNGLVMLSGLSPDARATVITDLQGREVTAIPVTSLIDMSGLVTGSYIVQVSGVTHRTAVRFVKE